MTLTMLVFLFLHMDTIDYQEERKRRGSRVEISKKLSVSTVTLWKRETGKVPISKESYLALVTLPLKAPHENP